MGRRRAVVALVAVVVAVFVGVGLVWAVSGSEQVSTTDLPDVRDLGVEVALERLAAVGIDDQQVRISRQRTDAAEPGTILSQSPPAGDPVPDDGRVLLVVALGDDAPVPDVVGERQADAVAAVEAAGFSVEVVEEPSERRAGTVLATDPPPGEATPTGSVVTLTVAVDPDAPFAVPDVVGAEVVATVARLDALGLEVDVRLEPNPAPKGTVLRTEPGAGTSVRTGDPVLVVASAGPDGDPGDPWPGSTATTGPGDGGGGGSPTTGGGGGGGGSPPTSGGGGGTTRPTTTTTTTTSTTRPQECQSVTIQPGYQDPDSGDYVPPVTQIQCR